MMDLLSWGRGFSAWRATVFDALLTPKAEVLAATVFFTTNMTIGVTTATPITKLIFSITSASNSEGNGQGIIILAWFIVIFPGVAIFALAGILAISAIGILDRLTIELFFWDSARSDLRVR